METYSTNRFGTKIETFDPCMIEEPNQHREIPQTVNQTQANNTTADAVEIQEVRTIQDEAVQHSEQIAGIQSNMTLTPVRLPALLDGEFFSVIRVEDSNVTVRCLQCDKNLNGNLKSTGNFLSHIKRVHPFMIEKIKCKSNQRKPAIAYVDLSVDKTMEIVKTKRGYRKCYKTEEVQVNKEEAAEQPNNWCDSPTMRRRKYDERTQFRRGPIANISQSRMATEHRNPNCDGSFTEIQPDETPDSLEVPKLQQQNNSYVVEDEFDAIGRNVAAKLRNMRLDQRIVAEKLLNDVLFEAQLGTLHRDSSLHV